MKAKYVNCEKMLDALREENCMACNENRGDDTSYCETRCDFYAFLNEVETYAEQCGINVQEDGKRYIDADMLIKAIPETRVDIFENCRNCTTLLRDEVVDIINDQPKIFAPEVKHGHWIYTGEDDVDRNGLYKCSECGAGEAHSHSVEVPFCWHCGASMKGS